jgi:metal-responsive CopG/Arc/MetJ family transcriptional regulator
MILIMGHTKISVTIPDEIYNDINEMASKEKIKLSHLVTEALIEKLRKKREQAYIQQVNKVFEDNEVAEEQQQMAELIADNTDVEELPW